VIGVVLLLLLLLLLMLSGCLWTRRRRRHRLPLQLRPAEVSATHFGSSLWLIGTVRAEPEAVISRAWVQSPDPAE